MRAQSFRRRTAQMSRNNTARVRYGGCLLKYPLCVFVFYVIYRAKYAYQKKKKKQTYVCGLRYSRNCSQTITTVPHRWVNKLISDELLLPLRPVPTQIRSNAERRPDDVKRLKYYPNKSCGSVIICRRRLLNTVRLAVDFVECLWAFLASVSN